MTTQSHGQILILSSAAGLRARNFNFVYGASKAGLDFFAQGLQKISIKNNVFITILRAGFVHTKMTHGLTPMPFATYPNIVAKIASNALKVKKDLVYAPTMLRYIVLILKLIPERLFRIIDSK
jgi:decaprenylphospho-beta-D-erythro-pentofuranosid-2-ulose 2-reductase